jgi:isopenicillin-N epimerase
MMTPKGSAFLFAAANVQELIGPLVVSWGDKSKPSSPFIQELEFLGTKDYAAYLSVPFAIEFMNKHDWATVRGKCHEVVRYYRREMTSLTGLEPIVPDTGTSTSNYFAQMSAHPLPSCDGPAFQRRLYDDFKIEIPVTEVKDRQFLRISIQGYNDIADVDRLLSAVKELLKDESIVDFR